jgi:hypothetical protein
MEDRLMVKLIEKVNCAWCKNQFGQTMATLDEISFYLKKITKCATDKCGCYLETVPGVYTCKMLTMELDINKPFKEKSFERFDDWDMTLVSVGIEFPSSKLTNL